MYIVTIYTDIRSPGVAARCTGMGRKHNFVPLLVAPAESEVDIALQAQHGLEY